MTKKDNRPPKELRTLKKGTVRGDGMVFRGYHCRAKNGEWWETRELHDAHCRKLELRSKSPDYLIAQRERQKIRYMSSKEREEKKAKEEKEMEMRKTLPNKMKFGYVRWDGMVFWSYMKNCKHGERWVTPELFERKLSEQTMRDAVKRAWKGGKDSFEIIGLPSSMAIDVDLHKKEIAQKIFPDQKLDRDHMRPLGGATSDEDARRRNHFTNFVYIPSALNQSKKDGEFWDWFKLQSASVQKCITLQCKYNEKIRRKIISQT